MALLDGHLCMVGKDWTCATNADDSTRWALVHGWEGLDLRDNRLASIVFNSFSTGCGRGYISQWLKRYGNDKLLSLLTVTDWKLALATWRKFQVQVSLNPAISLSRTETSVRSFLSRIDVLEHFEPSLTMVSIWKLTFQFPNWNCQRSPEERKIACWQGI